MSRRQSDAFPNFEDIFGDDGFMEASQNLPVPSVAQHTDVWIPPGLTLPMPAELDHPSVVPPFQPYLSQLPQQNVHQQRSPMQAQDSAILNFDAANNLHNPVGHPGLHQSAVLPELGPFDHWQQALSPELVPDQPMQEFEQTHIRRLDPPVFQPEQLFQSPARLTPHFPYRSAASWQHTFRSPDLDRLSFSQDAMGEQQRQPADSSYRDSMGQSLTSRSTSAIGSQMKPGQDSNSMRYCRTFLV